MIALSVYLFLTIAAIFQVCVIVYKTFYYYDINTSKDLRDVFIGYAVVSALTLPIVFICEGWI